MRGTRKDKDRYTMEVELPETFISSGKYYTIERFNITLSSTVRFKMETQCTRRLLILIFTLLICHSCVASMFCNFQVDTRYRVPNIIEMKLKKNF